ncbi:4-hydroxy-tetrahydrodipicolinate synthase [Geomicrobium halophilum]|uniref:4-hydroxy-tetrahydrodipicolinate synthase n=1 Tax=Geomicrobium halophilum TaxID=549000 RepID=A0A841PIQ4_9BACL|nr:dihydrodipicolinate synthase family protein [Geomicrobium halophilum]MBB6448680.1 4-hydroxy-tetrahydrodipicolinate synthase [Geomicrobium halophilum]
MNYKEISKKLETVSAINMLPFDELTKDINWEGLKENIHFLLNHGAEVIVPNGNTGEFYALTLQEAKAVNKKVVELVDGQATVVSGIGYSVDTAIELGEAADRDGADCVMIHQPIHPYITNKGAVIYFKKIIESLNLPSIIYFKDPDLSDEVIKELAPLEKLVGVKYAINDLPRLTKVIRDVPKEHNIAWICGTAEKWAPFFHNSGTVGFTSGLINVHPEKCFEMLHALRNEDHAKVWEVWEEILAFEDLRSKYNNGNNVVVIKETMEQLGMLGGVTREPVSPLNEIDKQEVSQIIHEWKSTMQPASMNHYLLNTVD